MSIKRITIIDMLFRVLFLVAVGAAVVAFFGGCGDNAKPPAPDAAAAVDAYEAPADTTIPADANPADLCTYACGAERVLTNRAKLATLDCGEIFPDCVSGCVSDCDQPIGTQYVCTCDGLEHRTVEVCAVDLQWAYGKTPECRGAWRCRASGECYLAL